MCFFIVWCCRLFVLSWILASVYLLMTGKSFTSFHKLLCHCAGLLLDCPYINIYAIVQGILNLFFVVLFGVTVILDKWFYEFYESKLPYISVVFDFALMFSIVWIMIGSVWIWTHVAGLDDDQSQCNNVLFVGATTYLCFHYLAFVLICCNCFKCRISNWCSKFGVLYKE